MRVLAVLAGYKHLEMLRTKPEYRKARRAWVHWFKRLRDQVDGIHLRIAQYHRGVPAVRHCQTAVMATYHGVSCAVCGISCCGGASSAC
jgi:hypothetical protein